MTKYREIIRLASLNLSQTNIALGCGASKKTVNKVLNAAREKGILWPLNPNQTDAEIEQLLFPKKNSSAITSSRTSRSAAPPCISIASLRSRLRLTGPEIRYTLISRIKVLFFTAVAAVRVDRRIQICYNKKHKSTGREKYKYE